MAYFPMFVDITDKKCLVVGGGAVAFRKIKVLRDFDAKVVVVASEFIRDIKCYFADDNKVTLLSKEFDDNDIDGCALVISATNDKNLNRHVADSCNERRIPVNVVDCKEECSFILPSYIREKNVVAAFSSSGNSPVVTQRLREENRSILTPFIGDINEYLGSYRSYVRQSFDSEEKRKLAFNRLYDKVLSEGKLLDDEQMKLFIRHLTEEI